MCVCVCVFQCQVYCCETVASVTTLTEKTTIYSTLVGILNTKNFVFGEEVWPIGTTDHVTIFDIFVVNHEGIFLPLARNGFFCS